MPGLAASQPYLIETIAGGIKFELPAEPVPAGDIRLILPEAVAGGPQGDIYIADTYYDRILRVTPSGSASTHAGTVTGFAGDGGPAASARFNLPSCLTFGPNGDLFVCDLNNGRIRRIAAGTGIVTTVVARLANPRAVAFDSAGTLHFTDSFNQTIGKVDSTGAVTVIAGRPGVPGFGGDDGPAVSATLNNPWGLAFDAAGNLYFSDRGNHRIRRITPQGVISTFAGTGVSGSAPNNTPVANALLSLPSTLAFNRQGDLFIGDGPNGLVRRIRNGIVTNIAGAGTIQTMPGRASTTDFLSTGNLALDREQQILVIDSQLRRVYRIDPANDTIDAVAGAVVLRGGGDGGPATSASLIAPFGIAVDANGSVYVADTSDHRVRKIDSGGVMSTFAGNGQPAISGDGGPAASAAVGAPRGLAFDRSGNLYIVGIRGAVVRKVTPEGVISTFAGGPLAGLSGDGGPAARAQLRAPNAVAADRDGNIYIADSGNHRIRRVDPSGVISTVAGGNQSGFSGDGGPAAAALLFTPMGVAVDADGNLFISDGQNNRIRRVSRDGIITTVAQVPFPGALAFDAQGNLLISRGRQIQALRPDGSLELVAGNGDTGFSGDGGPAIAARITTPGGIALGADEAIYFTDQTNERVRKLTPVRITSAGVFNLASNLAGPLAPNQMIRIRGIRLGPASPAIASPGEAGAYPKSLAGVEAFADGTAIPLVSVQESSVVAIVPSAIAGALRIQLGFEGRLTNAISVETAAASPAIFTVNAETGKGPAAARNSDGAPITAEAPARVGAEITIRLTGAGAVDPILGDGALAPDDSSKPVLPIEVTAGGKPAEVVAAYVPAGQPAGIVEVRLRVPEVEAGEVPLVVRVQGASSQEEVTLFVGPV